MSYSTLAITVFGVELSWKDLYVVTQVRGCKHKKTDSPFCGICGTRMYIDKDAAVKAYDRQKNLLGLLDVVFNDSGQMGKCYVGILLGVADAQGGVPSELPLVEVDAVHIEKELRESLPQLYTGSRPVNPHIRLWTFLRENYG